jgi:uncharacterized protein
MSNPPTTTAALSEAEARALYVTGDAAHDFDHVLRVTRLALHLAVAEGADQIVVQQAALLHDVPTAVHGATRQAHHFAAAEYAQEVLQARGMDQKRLANVVHCIEAHRFRDQSVQPQTLEAQCLYDADKLDSMGAIGVARAFAFAGSHNNRLWTTPHAEIAQAMAQSAAKPVGADYTPVHEFVYKLDRLYATLYTATARRIGAERHAFMQNFYEQLDAEMRQVYRIV